MSEATDGAGTPVDRLGSTAEGSETPRVRVNVCATSMTRGITAERLRLCAAAEDGGLDGMMVGDHVSFFTGAGSDGLIGATSILSASERLGAAVAVYLLPLRHPVTVARQVADIVSMAPGRLLLGVGIGGEDPHELEICGVDPRTRGRRMDEHLGVLRGLLGGGPVTFEGEFVSVEAALIEPVPTEPVPILVGGRSSAAIRRAGRLGDGWLGVWVSARRFAGAVEEMEAAAEEAGRSGVQWHNALNVWCGVGDSVRSARSHVAPKMQDFYQTPYEAFEKWSPAGETKAVAEFLAPYVEAGCHTFNLITCGESWEAEVEGAAEVASLLRG